MAKSRASRGVFGERVTPRTPDRNSFTPPVFGTRWERTAKGPGGWEGFVNEVADSAPTNSVAPSANASQIIGTDPGYVAGTWSSGTPAFTRWESSATGVGSWSTAAATMPNANSAPTSTEHLLYLRVIETNDGVEAASAATGKVVFNPATITGLQLWLDPTDTATLFQTTDTSTPALLDAAAVGRINDKSGNSGREAIQATAANKPTLKLNILNGLQVLRTDGGDRVVSTFGSTLSQPATIFLVIKWSAIGTSARIAIDGIDASNRNYLAVNTAGTNYEIFAGASINRGTPDTNWHVITVRYDGANSFIRDNGAQVGAVFNSGAHAATGMTLGSGYNNAASMTGDIAQVIRAGTLSAGDITLIEAHLNNKFALNP